MHRVFYFPDSDGLLAAGTRTLRYANFHGCFFAQAGDLERAGRHLALGNDQATIFHLTDERGICAGAADAEGAHERCQRFLNELEAFIAAGGRFVWSADAETALSPLADERSADFRSHLGTLAHLIHCTSYRRAQAIQAVLDLDWRKFVVVSPGSFQPLIEARPGAASAGRAAVSPKERLGLGEGDRLVVHVGGGDPAGGADRLLALWRGARPAKATLLLLGAVADRITPEKAAALEAGRVLVRTHVGKVATLAAWVAAADLVVLPYRQYTGAAELMLALTCGRPALIPALPPLLELVTPGRDALTFEPGDGDDALRAAVLGALDLDDDRLAAIGADAALRAEAMPWRMLGRQLADAFLRVAAGGAAQPALEPAAAPISVRPRLVG